MRILNLYRRQTASLLCVVLITYFSAGFACDRQQQPKTVADALTTMGNIKREAKKAGEITAQQDLDISRKLHDANRAYKQFVVDEQARIAAGKPDPSARTAALNELRSLVNGLSDPAALGIKSSNAQKAWAASVTTLNTVLAAFGG
jgi:hypothetical protein